ncbi:MAG: hypothetical protein SFU86_07425 [Pirellulaceae bacterium]|nr:hypothetical protein [Pirellulaceae bacterium]
MGVLDAAVINTAARWEQHALLATRWLRISFDQLSHDQRLNFSREIARASSERDKALRELRLNAAQRADVIDLCNRSQPRDFSYLPDDSPPPPAPEAPTPPAGQPEPAAGPTDTASPTMPPLAQSDPPAAP